MKIKIIALNILFVIVLIYFDKKIIMCDDWSIQDYTMNFDNSFNTWTADWFFDNIITLESFFIDDEELEIMKDFNNLKLNPLNNATNHSTNNNVMNVFTFDVINPDDSLLNELNDYL